MLDTETPGQSRAANDDVEGIREALVRSARWARGNSAQPPGDDEVHVWRIRLEVPRGRRVQQSLSPDELARAERFRFEEDRRRFTVARGSLRAILARYLGVPPGDLRFRYGRRGKPRLADGTGGLWLRFNLAHSHDRALCAVATRREVGVDLERVVLDRDTAAIAEQWFSADESAFLRAAPAERRSRLFYSYWTQKEAYVKATGDGLLLSTRRASHDASRWSLHTLDLWPGYAAALVVEGHDVRIMSREWSPGPLPPMR